jgi:hypothetical protein
LLKILKILNIAENSEQILNIAENSEQILKILKIAENSEQILNITENSEQILNRIFRHFSEFLAQKLVYSESLDFVVL